MWKSLVLPSCYLSVGEDSRVCAWGLDGTLLISWKAHDGSCVWSITATEDGTTIVTGGGDGSVKSWCLKLECPKHPEVMTRLPWTFCDDEMGVPNCEKKNLQADNTATIDDDTDHNCDTQVQDDNALNSEPELFCSQAIDKLKKVKKNKTVARAKEDFPRCVSLLGLDTYLVMMDSGKLYSWITELSKWFFIYEDMRLKNYALMESRADQGLVAVGTLCGSVIILKMGLVSQFFNI